MKLFQSPFLLLCVVASSVSAGGTDGKARPAAARRLCGVNPLHEDDGGGRGRGGRSTAKRDGGWSAPPPVIPAHAGIYRRFLRRAEPYNTPLVNHSLPTSAIQILKHVR